jgi:hypothetical protein
VSLPSLKKLLQRRRTAQQFEAQRLERTPEELERDRDLLERVAAGVALNKTPGR